VGSCWLDWPGSRWEPLAGACEQNPQILKKPTIFPENWGPTVFIDADVHYISQFAR